jgi:hypothetical protein
MGDLESVRLGGGGVYQEWADGARACLRAIEQVLGIALKTSRKSRRFPSSRVHIAHIALPLITQLTSLRRCKFSDKGVEALHRI